MKSPAAKTRQANRRLFAALAVFALLLCTLVILWKTFFT
jgi:hypothetical protein